MRPPKGPLRPAVSALALLAVPGFAAVGCSALRFSQPGKPGT
jgi:hypothetical protein